jgi:hypothetical protein
MVGNPEVVRFFGRSVRASWPAFTDLAGPKAELQLASRLAPSRNAPSLAVALNCGMGSSSLNAEVKAFDKLHIVRG